MGVFASFSVGTGTNQEIDFQALFSPFKSRFPQMSTVLGVLAKIVPESYLRP